jgi:cation diffusion facilitator family transporter
MFILISRLMRSGANLRDPALRKKYGVISGGVGICLNLLLFAGKLMIALASGSVAVIADAFNNLSDAGSSIVTMIGFRLSDKKPDPEHPFGHGRFEYITGFVVSVIIIVMSYELGKSSVESILSPEPVLFNAATATILGVSVAVKLYMALYNYRLFKLFDSAALKATALDSVSDAVSTFVVTGALLISRYPGAQLDGPAGLVVSAFVFYTGFMAAKETLSPLLGNPPRPELVSEIERIVLAHPPIVGIHDLVVHDYGPGRLMISLHAEVPSDIGVFYAHDVIDNVEFVLGQELGCEAVVHFDPIDTNDESLSAKRRTIESIVRGIDERLSIHDFRSVPGQTHTNLLFDVVLPYNFELKDEAVKEERADCVQKLLPNHFCIIKLDRTYV